MGIFQEQWRIVRVVLVASLLAIVTAGGSISWMKLDGMVACIEETGEECPCKVPTATPLSAWFGLGLGPLTLRRGRSARARYRPASPHHRTPRRTHHCPPHRTPHTHLPMMIYIMRVE